MEIVRLSAVHCKGLLSLYRTVTAHLRDSGIHQWDWFYPNGFVIQGDIRRGAAYGILDGNQIIGAMAVDDRQSDQYHGLPWSDPFELPACIHRLAVHPAHQGQGHGKRLLCFAEEEARLNGATSIRLDVFSGNAGAVQMYLRAGYAEVGTIRFPMRRAPYICMEKLL